MEGVTYSLRARQVNSDEYYDKVAEFTNEVLIEGTNILSSIIEGYLTFINTRQSQQNNSKEELILELLILGILGKAYGEDALKLNNTQYRLLTWATKLLQQNYKLKPVMNVLKGIMATLFLHSKSHQNKVSVVVNIKHLIKLIQWLEASGEFNNEVKRLKIWVQYFCTLSKESVLDILTTVSKFSLWFEIHSETALGEYTSKVNEYLNQIKNKRYWREDIIFCQRRRVEYHLNMIGAEIMNRAFRKDFIATNKKVLVLPICMTSPSNLNCQSEVLGKRFVCKNCSSKCMVNQLTRLGEKEAFGVMVIPHQSSIPAYSREGFLFDGENTGGIGVACVTNLISGGWLLKDMGVPAQCVLLDFSGCKSHWHDEGISTCINLNKLRDILKQE